MKSHIIFTCIWVFLFTVGCQTQVSPTAQPENTPAKPLQLKLSHADAETPPKEQGLGYSCAAPNQATAAACQAETEKILNATVRIKLEYGSGGKPIPSDQTTSYEITQVTSHATLVNKRYLVTHNHFPISPRLMKENAAGLELRLSLYTLNNDLILRGASTRNFDVFVEFPETLVLDFRESGEVLFKAFGVQSVSMGTIEHVPLSPGMEVAQVNWDGVTTWVEWVRVEEVIEEQGITLIVLNQGVQKGGSGGGVFWHGLHIGNNWKTCEVRAVLDSQPIRMFSIAVSNAELVWPP